MCAREIFGIRARRVNLTRGMISAAQAGAQNKTGLVLARFFLGFVEAPFFCGAVMMMSSWYTRKELAHRIAWFYSATCLANAFGGLIAAGVLGNCKLHVFQRRKGLLLIFIDSGRCSRSLRMVREQ